MNAKEFQELMRKKADFDKSSKQVQISASNLKEALKKASNELDVSVSKINYDILQKGNIGFLGFARKKWLIIAYKAISYNNNNSIADEDELLFNDEIEEIKSIDGEAIIVLRDEKVYLTVREPLGLGKKAQFIDIEQKLAYRGVSQYDSVLAKRTLKAAENKPVCIGEFIYNENANPELDIIFSDDDMSASIIISKPGPGGQDFTYSFLMEFIALNGVLFGVDNDKVKELSLNPIYDEEYTVAFGQKPLHGKNAFIDYKFERDVSKRYLVDINGKIDFKKMRQIENIIKGQILAEKHELTLGVDGTTIFGKSLPSRDGSDIDLLVGNNVNLSDDGLTATAGLNGQVMIIEGMVVVDPIYVINGDISLKTVGNIDFIGSIVVKGDIQDGFTVKASKNIQVFGTVGKSNLIAGGDIVVGRGIQTSTECLVESHSAIYAKFISNSNIKAEQKVIVADGIVNSNIDTKGKIICNGKRASIHGGILRAGEMVVSNKIGAISGTETVIEVGVDPDKLDRFQKIDKLLHKSKEEIKNLDLNIQTFENSNFSSTDEKLAHYKEMKIRKHELISEFEIMSEEHKSLKEFLASLKANGTVSAESVIYPGVKINIGASSTSYRVKSELKWVTFFKDGYTIKTKAYSIDEKQCL